MALGRVWEEGGQNLKRGREIKEIERGSDKANGAPKQIPSLLRFGNLGDVV